MHTAIHKPSFRWQDNLIYDGDVVIAQFRQDPEAKRHIGLVDVRLTPGGAALVSWTLSWHYGHFCTTSKLLSLDVHNSGGKELAVDFTAATPDETYTARTHLTISFDAQRQCYRYEAISELQINRIPYYSWREIDGSSEYHRKYLFFPSEFANFVPLESYGYYAPVDTTPKKWQAFVYQNAGGGWSRVPQHHLLTPDKYDIFFPAGRCRMGFVDDPSGNPCVELIERVPSTSQGGICWCMNDIHLHVIKSDLNTRHRVRYALYQFTAEETAEILARTRDYAYTEEEREIYDRPRFDGNGTCSFDKGVDFSEPDDCLQFWLPRGEIRYTSWRHDEGRNGGRCLKNVTPEPARVLWQVEGSNAPVVPAGRCYRVAAWVKTDGLEGEAYLEVWDNERPASPVRSEPARGVSGWREVAVEVDVPDNGRALPGRLCIRLEHNGKGTSWFDDVSLRDIGPARR